MKPQNYFKEYLSKNVTLNNINILLFSKLLK